MLHEATAPRPLASVLDARARLNDAAPDLLHACLALLRADDDLQEAIGLARLAVLKATRALV
jgi:hypothetical protein